MFNDYTINLMLTDSLLDKPYKNHWTYTELTDVNYVNKEY